MPIETLKLTGNLKDRKAQLPHDLRESLGSLSTAREKFHDFRNRYCKLDPNDQLTVVSQAMDHQFGIQTRDWFFELHFGDADAWLKEDQLEGLPDRAKERMKQNFSSSTKNLWPFLLTDPENSFVKTVEIENGRNYNALTSNFLNNYLFAASRLGIFPFTPKPESVANQRLMDHHDRRLAADLLFVKQIGVLPENFWVASPLLTYLSHAMDVYYQIEVPILQQMVKEKANLALTDIQTLTEEGMWNDHDDLVAMLVDRGIRDHLTAFYGLYRSVLIPQNEGLKGYHVSQLLAERNARFRSLLKVNG